MQGWFLLLLVVATCERCSARTIQASQSGRWSSGETWAGGNPPQYMDAVVIPAEISVVVDASPASLRSLLVEEGGKITFDEGVGAGDTQLVLNAETILVAGYFGVGSEDNLFARGLLINLMNYEAPPLRADDMALIPSLSQAPYGQKMLLVYDNGQFEVHAVGRSPTWTNLEFTAPVGATSVTLPKGTVFNWQVGDVIVIATTDWSPSQTERRIISAIDGLSIHFDAPLKYEHFSQNMTYGEFTASIRGEVGVLTSNVHITGERNISIYYNVSEREPYYDIYQSMMNYGGHIAFFGNVTAHVEGVELSYLGQGGRLGRYPLHWHFVDSGYGQYAKRITMHDLYLRCIVIHSTDGVLLRDNVCVDTVGSGYFLEVGDEELNIFDHNLAIHSTGVQFEQSISNGLSPPDTGYYKRAQCTAGPSPGIRVEYTDYAPSAFWITSVNNTFTFNSAVAYSWGYWVRVSYSAEEPEYALGCTLGPPCCNPGGGNLPNNIGQTGLVFEDNVAHAILQGAWWVREFWEPTIQQNVTRFTVYKSGVVINNYHVSTFVVYDGIISVDNARTFTTSYVDTNSHNNTVLNTLMVGESPNHGTPMSLEDDVAISIFATTSLHLGVAVPSNCSAIFPNATRTRRNPEFPRALYIENIGFTYMYNVTFVDMKSSCFETPLMDGNVGFFYGEGGYPGSPFWGAISRAFNMHNVDPIGGKVWDKVYFSNVEFYNTLSSLSGQSYFSANFAGSGYYDVDGSHPCSAPSTYWIQPPFPAYEGCTFMSAYGMYKCPDYEGGTWVQISFMPGWVPIYIEDGCSSTPTIPDSASYQSHGNFRTDGLPYLNMSGVSSGVNLGIQATSPNFVGMWMTTSIPGPVSVGWSTYSPARPDGETFFSECRCNVTWVKFWVSATNVAYNVPWLSLGNTLSFTPDPTMNCSHTVCTNPWPPTQPYSCSNGTILVDNRVCDFRPLPMHPSVGAPSNGDGEPSNGESSNGESSISLLSRTLLSLVLLILLHQ